MDRKSTNFTLLRRQPKVVAIVAAYNEEPRIKAVLEVLSSYPGFDEVVVVDDGSTDNTVLEALRAGASVLIQRNHGKGKAMDAGVKASHADVIFFCDADIVGLTHEMIASILEPVLNQRTSMMVAMRHRKVYDIPAVIHGISLLGGERAVTRELWDSVPDKFKDRFMIETALNYYAYRNGGFQFKIFKDLTQVIKESKHGFFRGFIARLQMFYDIAKTHLLLRLPK